MYRQLLGNVTRQLYGHVSEARRSPRSPLCLFVLRRPVHGRASVSGSRRRAAKGPGEADSADDADVILGAQSARRPRAARPVPRHRQRRSGVTSQQKSDGGDGGVFGGGGGGGGGRALRHRRQLIRGTLARIRTAWGVPRKAPGGGGGTTPADGPQRGPPAADRAGRSVSLERPDMGAGGGYPHAGPSAVAATVGGGTRPGLPLRRYSVPEVVMRKASLRMRAAAGGHDGSKKQEESCAKCDATGREGAPPSHPDVGEVPDNSKKKKNVSVISERSVVKCETTSQRFSMTLSSSTTTECKVSVSNDEKDVPKVPEPCSKSERKRHRDKRSEELPRDPEPDDERSRLDTITELSCSTTVDNSDNAGRDLTEEDQEVQNILSENRGSTPCCCRHARRSSTPPCEDVCSQTEIAVSPSGKNRPDSASSSVTLDQSVSERSSSTQDSTLSVRTETNSPPESKPRRMPTPYRRIDRKGVIRDVCGNKVHVLSETSSFVVFETPSPSPSPTPSPTVSNSSPVNDSVQCCCACCKRCERECKLLRSKQTSQTTQTIATEDKTTSVNRIDRHSSKARFHTESNSATVGATVNRGSTLRREESREDFVPDEFGVDANGNVTFCSSGVDMEENVPKSKFVQTNENEEEKEEKQKDVYLVKTETIEKWDNEKREWTEKKVSHVVQHQPGPPVRDAKTYTLSNKINIANNNPTLVASEIVEIPLTERHPFCLNNPDSSTCPICRDGKRDVTLPSIKTSNEAQNMKNEAEFWSRLVGQSTRAQTNIPVLEQSQAKETAAASEEIYQWSKLPENVQPESTVVDVTTPLDSIEATIVPRFSAVPRTVSMVVNTSSPEASDDDSECLSCADSLENVSVPRKSNKHDSKPVRGHVLPPEAAPKKEVSHRVEPPKVFFVRLSDEDGAIEGEMTPPVSECLPEKLKEKLVERHTFVRLHTGHCHHHEEDRHHSRSHDHHHDHRPTQERTHPSPQHRSMGSQAEIDYKESATKSTGTQHRASRSKRTVPAVVRVHKCHLEESVRPAFKAKPYKASPSMKSRQPKQTSESAKVKFEPPKVHARSQTTPTIPKHATDTTHHKHDHVTVVKEPAKLTVSEEKEVQFQSSCHTQTTPSIPVRKEEHRASAQKPHNFNHAMQTQTTPPRSVETLTTNLEPDGNKRTAKSSQTDKDTKSRPAKTPTERGKETKPRNKDTPPTPHHKTDSSKTQTSRQITSKTKSTLTEVHRNRREIVKADESNSENDNHEALGDNDEMTASEESSEDRRTDSSSQTSPRLTTPRRPGSIARFRHKFPVIPEEQREVSPSSPSRSVSQRRSPAHSSSSNAMSQTDSTEKPKHRSTESKATSTATTTSGSSTDYGSRSENDQESQAIQCSFHRTSPDFHSQSQQTDSIPVQPLRKPTPSKTSGGTQTEQSDVTPTRPVVPIHAASTDASTVTEARKTDASTSTSNPPRSTVSSATSVHKETITKSMTTMTSATMTSATMTQKETIKATTTLSSAPPKLHHSQQPTNTAHKITHLPDKPTHTIPAAPKVVVPKHAPTSKPATTAPMKPSESVPVTKHARESGSSRYLLPKDSTDSVKTSAPASAKGSWASKGAGFESNQAYHRRKAAGAEHVRRLQRVLRNGPSLSLSACDDISSGGSCQSDSTHYLSPADLSTTPPPQPSGWVAKDAVGEVGASGSVAGRRHHVRQRVRRADLTSSGTTNGLLYRHHEPPRLSAPGPPPPDGAGWTVTVAGGSTLGNVVGGVSGTIEPGSRGGAAPELEMRVMIAEATTAPTSRSAGSSRWSLTIRNQPTSAMYPQHHQHPPDSASSRRHRPPSLTWPRVHQVNGSSSPRHSDSSPHQLSVTGSAIQRKFTRHLD